MDKKRLLLWVVLLTALLLTGCGYAAPEKAVHQELELIRKLDENTIQSFISYENIRLSDSAPLEADQETTAAVKLFFKNFKYRICSSSMTEDKEAASVRVNITNLDARQLARDLCSSMIMASSTQEGSSEQTGLVSSFALMKQCLEENTYPLVTTEVTIDLTKQGETWTIQENSDLEDALTGGLVSCLQDPYLLSPEEVLKCRLAPFADFTGQEWINYLQLNDVFNTGSELAPSLDAELADQIARFFDFKIDRVLQDGDSAAADVTITSLNLQGVLDKCREALLAYAQTTESIRATDPQIAQKTGEYLLEALQANTESSSLSLTISLLNNGHTWDVFLDKTFADALLGGMDAALKTLYPAE